MSPTTNHPLFNNYILIFALFFLFLGLLPYSFVFGRYRLSQPAIFLRVIAAHLRHIPKTLSTFPVGSATSVQAMPTTALCLLVTEGLLL